jgi:hypothetical protein
MLLDATHQMADVAVVREEIASFLADGTSCTLARSARFELPSHCRLGRSRIRSMSPLCAGGSSAQSELPAEQISSLALRVAAGAFASGHRSLLAGIRTVAIRSNICSRTMTGFVLAFLVFHGVSFRSDTCTNRAEFLRGRNHKGRPARAHPHRKQLAARSPLHDQDAPLTAKLVTALDVILCVIANNGERW